MKKWIVFVTAVAAWFATSSVSQAVPLVPGDNHIAVSGTSGPVGTVLEDVVTSFSTGAWGGTLRTIVLRDTSVANFGNIDYLYQITRTDSNPDHVIARMTVADFTGYLTSDVGFTSDSYNGHASGTRGLFEVDRRVPGTLGYNFSGLGLLAGETTSWMFAVTNSVDYRSGTAHIIDDATADVASFAPAPEPASLTLLGLGCAGVLGSYGWRRRRALQN